jgi:gamma-glutamylputrescine oxidase
MGSVEATNIVFCIDKMQRALSHVADHIYHAQTFMSVSEPLSTEEIQELFPAGEFMCWDSKLVYSYYRLTGDRRLLLGGGSALTTFSPMDVTPPRIIERVIADFRHRFPFLKEHEFTQYWPGRIDTTKDLIPIVDFDPHKPHIQYVLGCVGLPWATFCGDYAASRILDPSINTHAHFLRLDRPYLIPLWIQKCIGKMAAFSFNNLYSKYFQREGMRKEGTKH